jgi:hypothetical protein
MAENEFTPISALRKADDALSHLLQTELTEMEHLDLHGDPTVSTVELITVSRAEVEAALVAVEKVYPELRRILRVTAAMMCALDSVRDEAAWSASVAQHFALTDGEKCKARLSALLEFLGHWGQKRRLFVH